MATNESAGTATVEPVIEYQEAEIQTRNTSNEVLEDWMAGVYPDSMQSNRQPGTIYNPRYTGVQHDDEHHTGTLYWNGKVLAVRTMGGYVFKNAGMTGSRTAIRIGYVAEQHGLEYHHFDFDALPAERDLHRVVEVEATDDSLVLVFADGEEMEVDR